jgi:glycosyltransferase involved in cell wall biosynthesis
MKLMNLKDTKNESLKIDTYPLVSVIIPCYNQSHFVGEAIESILNQTYPHHEIIVIDDGSKDNSSLVASKYSQVRCIKQKNQGRCAARNRGVKESKGRFLVFLDADDRLLPNALEAGIRCFKDKPECGLVYGSYYHMTEDGNPIPTEYPTHVERDHYRELLRTNYIGMHAAVMYRRDVFESIGGFNNSLVGAEDYDLYFRIAKEFPIYGHKEVIAEYRRHGTNTTSNLAIMIRDTNKVMRAQWSFIKGKDEYEEAYRVGMRRWREYWGDQFVNDIRSGIRQREWNKVLKGIGRVLKYYPEGFFVHAYRKLYCIIFRVKSDYAS